MISLTTELEEGACLAGGMVVRAGAWRSKSCQGNPFSLSARRLEMNGLCYTWRREVGLSLFFNTPSIWSTSLSLFLLTLIFMNLRSADGPNIPDLAARTQPPWEIQSIIKSVGNLFHSIWRSAQSWFVGLLWMQRHSIHYDMRGQRGLGGGLGGRLYGAVECAWVEALKIAAIGILICNAYLVCNTRTFDTTLTAWLRGELSELWGKPWFLAWLKHKYLRDSKNLLTARRKDVQYIHLLRHVSKNSERSLSTIHTWDGRKHSKV